MTFEERYIKSANKGDFQYSVTEADDCTGKIYTEECRYKGKCVGIIRNDCDQFEEEVDDLHHEPSYICQFRSSRKAARELLERIILNDELNNGKNMKYI